jgi:hypothetical protein
MPITVMESGSMIIRSQLVHLMDAIRSQMKQVYNLMYTT